MGFYNITGSNDEQLLELQVHVKKLKNFILESKNSGFFADNLITIGRNLGFMEDYKFQKSLNSSIDEPEDVNKTWRLHIYTWAIRSSLEIDGDLIECGVYRGLYVNTCIKYLKDIIKDKTFYLYDTFQGLDDRYSSEFETALSKTGTFDKIGIEDEVRQKFADYNTPEPICKV